MCLKKMGFVSNCSIIDLPPFFNDEVIHSDDAHDFIYTHPMVAFYSFLLECIWS